MLAEGEEGGTWVNALETMLDILDVDVNPDTEAAQEDFTQALQDFVALLLPHTLKDGHDALDGWQRSSGHWMPYPIDEAAARKRPPGVVLVWREITLADRSADDAVSDAEDQSSVDRSPQRNAHTDCADLVCQPLPIIAHTGDNMPSDHRHGSQLAPAQRAGCFLGATDDHQAGTGIAAGTALAVPVAPVSLVCAQPVFYPRSPAAPHHRCLPHSWPKT
jgi:hypothetical protein